MAAHNSPLFVHYRLNEIDGVTVRDQSGFGTDATASSNPPTLQSDDTFGSVMDFNGTDQFLTLNFLSTTDLTTDQTIMMWLYPRSFDERANPYAKAYGGEGTITQETTGRVSYYYGESGANSAPHHGLTSNTALVMNQWNHIAIVRDLDNGLTHWYINGVLDISGVAIQPPAVSTLPAMIGKGYVSNYDGRIAQFRMFSQALDGDGIREIMQRDAAGIRIHWRMDQLEENLVLDRSGHNQHGTLFGNPALVPDGTFGTCLKLNATGSDDGIRLESVDFPGEAVSASIWVRPEYTTPEGIFSYAGNSATTNGFLLFDSANLRPHILNESLGSGTSITDGEWHHVTQTWRKSDGQVQLFVDGEKVFTAILKAGETMPSGGTLIIGQDQDSVGGGFQASQALHGRIAHFRLYDRVVTETQIQEEMEADLVGLSAYRKSYPIEFELHDDDHHDVLYIDDDANGHVLYFDLTNTSDEIVQWSDAGSTTPSASNYVFQLRFRTGTLAAATIAGIVVRQLEWKMAAVAEADFVSLYFLPTEDGSLNPGEVMGLTLDNVKADGTQGTRGTVVELRYDQLLPAGGTEPLRGNRIHHLNLVNYRGRKTIPLRLAFTDSNAIQNTDNAANSLELRVFNDSDEVLQFNPQGSAQASQFILHFDVQKDGENKPWALGTASEVQGIDVAVAGWDVTEPDQGTEPEWIIESPGQASIAPGEMLTLSLTSLRSSLPSGLTEVRLHYMNVPGFKDGTLRSAILKSPLVTRGNDVGLGTASPHAQLALGTWNAGYAGPSDGAQLHLGGRHNTGTNLSGKKLLIDGYNNDGTLVYPIYVMDENSKKDFYLRNRPTFNGFPRMYFAGDVGLATETPDAQLALGTWNAGYAGKSAGIQLHLSGKHNSGANLGGKKLVIDGYDNDGSTVYPIYVKDENHNEDFYLKNRPKHDQYPMMFFAGDVGIGTKNPHAQFGLGAWNEGYAGEDGGVQLRLSGKHGHGANTGPVFSNDPISSSEVSIIHPYVGAKKLLIEGYDNDGTIVFPIFVQDESEDPDFYLQNRDVPYGHSLAYFQGNVGIGIQPFRLTPYRLNVDGKIAAQEFVQLSSIKLKENVAPITNALEMIDQLEGVHFTWKKDGAADLGFIAEEVAKVIPEAVTENSESGIASMSYSKVTPLLVNAMKEQQAIIETQSQAIQALQEAVAELQAQLQDRS